MTFDACVIGAGIIGSTTAIFLARRGMKIILAEKQPRPFQDATRAGFGALTPYSDPYFTGSIAAVAEKSLRIYRESWIPYLEEVSSLNIELSQNGLIQIFCDQVDWSDEFSKYENGLIPEYQPKLLTADEIHLKEPNITAEICGGIYHPEPWIDLEAYLSGIEDALDKNPNITCKFGSATNRVDTDDSLYVYFDDETSVKCKKIVYAPGLHGDSVSGLPAFPMNWIRGDGLAIRTQNNKPIFNNIIHYKPAFLTPRSNGLMLLGSTYEDEGLASSANISAGRDSISFKAAQEILSSNRLISHHLEDCTIERSWRGWRPASLDNIPIVGPLPMDERIVVATGFLGLGITLSAGVADQIEAYFCDNNKTFLSESLPDRFERV